MTPQSVSRSIMLVDGGGAGEIARAVGHVLHGVDQRHDVVLLDVDVLDGLLEEFFFGSHSHQDINLPCVPVAGYSLIFR